MRAKTTRKPDEVVRATINQLLINKPRESITYLVDLLRFNHGIAFPTGHSAAMDEFERLGFALDKERNKYGSLLRTYVRANPVAAKLLDPSLM